MKVSDGSVVAWTPGSRFRIGAGDDVARGGFPRLVPTSDGMGVGVVGAVPCARSVTGGWSGALGFFTWLAAYAYEPASTSKVVTSDPTLSARADI